jgi:FolB domain-containing protein
MDRIVIRDLRMRCTLGVRDEERRDRQEVLVSAWLKVDLNAAGQSDDIGQSVDYRAICKRLLQDAESSDFTLAEALAEHLAAACLSVPGVRAVRLRVEKPCALRFARTVWVEVRRRA